MKNKTILITGATGGIGSEIASHLDELGYQLILLGKNREKLDRLNNKLENKHKIHLIPNLSESIQFDEVVKSLGQLDGVVHTLGMISPYPLKFIKEEQINAIFQVNFNTTVLLTSALLRNKRLNKNASLVFMSSISAHFPYPGGALYAATKAALESFSKSVALEHAKQGIRSNVVSPALIKTDMFEQTRNAYSEEEFKKITDSYPLGIGEPKDVAELVSFLISDASKWMTGNVINLDGGLLLNGVR